MEASGADIELEKLVEYSKALKDYKNTGVKQCLAILKELLESNTTLNQLKESKLGATLSKIAKEEFTDAEEKQIKEEAIKVFKRCKQREEKNSQGDGDKNAEKPPVNGTKPPTEPRKPEKEEKKAPVEEKKEPERAKKEEKKSSAEDVFGLPDDAPPVKRTNNPPPVKRDPPKEPERKKESVKKESSSGSGVNSLPFLEPQHRNFTLKSFVDGLLMDYKADPAGKEKMKPIANKKAVEIEKILNDKVRGQEVEYRLEARNLTTFLQLKNNSDLRRHIMDNDGDCRDFVYNKENFMNQNARDKIEKTSRRLIDAANADYDKRIIRESELYQCKNCKSRRISKTEKQTRSGDEPMTSFFTCVDCGKGWKEG